MKISLLVTTLVFYLVLTPFCCSGWSFTQQQSQALKTIFTSFTNLGRDREPVGVKNMWPKTKESNKEACEVCDIALKLLVPVAEDHLVYPEVVKFAKFLCKREKWFTDRVCDGAVDMFKDELYAVLPVIRDSPHSFCSKFLKLECGYDDNPLKPWNTTIPPEPKTPIKPVQPSRSTMTILHLSDLHFVSKT